MRHAEDQMIVTHRQQFLLALGEPLVAMTAERSGAVTGDSIEHLRLRPGQRRAFAEPAACLADHIGHLEGWTCHLCCCSCAVRSVSWSSGLMAACRCRCDRCR